MGDLFNRLQSEMDNREEGGGISAIDLLDLPPRQILIMRFMLRAVVVSQIEIIKETAGWKGDRMIPKPDLLQEIEILVQEGWVILLGEPDAPNYRVNLRRKRASNLDASIWGALDSKITERIAEQKGKKNKLADSLDKISKKPDPEEDKEE